MSNKRKIAALALVVCLAVAGWTGYMGISELLERKSGMDYYADLALEVPVIAQATATPKPTATPEPEQDVPLDIAAERPLLDFDTLRVRFPDIVGWIAIEGSQINYPVVQGVDNDFYLTHLPDKEKNSAGSIMMDASCDPHFDSAVTILHGHNMRSGAMFGSLDAYAVEGYYEEHPMLQLSTPGKNYDVELFCATVVDSRTFGYPTYFEDEEAFDAFVKELRRNSEFESDVEVVFGDRLLMLSTCAYAFDDARLVVVGKIVDDAQA